MLCVREAIKTSAIQGTAEASFNVICYPDEIRVFLGL